MCEAKNGKILSHAGKTVAYLDTMYLKTVRSQSCMLLIVKVDETGVKNVQLSPIYILKNKLPLSSPQKKKQLKLVKQALRNKQRQLQWLRKKLDYLTAEHGVIADDSLQSDLVKVLVQSSEEINIITYE